MSISLMDQTWQEPNPPSSTNPKLLCPVSPPQTWGLQRYAVRPSTNNVEHLSPIRHQPKHRDYATRFGADSHRSNTLPLKILAMIYIHLKQRVFIHVLLRTYLYIYIHTHFIFKSILCVFFLLM